MKKKIRIQLLILSLIKEIFPVFLFNKISMEIQLNDMCYKAYILKLLSKPISDSIITYTMLLVLLDSYSTLYTIFNSSPATLVGSSLSTNVVIT